MNHKLEINNNWIFDPQSQIYPTDLFLIGYSFGSSILGHALNRVLQSNCTDQAVIDEYSSNLQRISLQSLSLHVKNALRGTIFISYPIGFFARCILGSHITHLRSLSTYLCQESNKPTKNNKNPPDPKQPNQPPMMYFVIDEDDEITSPQTIVDLVESFPFPTTPESKREMVQLLRTKTGHTWSGSEHILALLLSVYFCKSIGYYNANVDLSLVETVSNDENNAQNQLEAMKPSQEGDEQATETKSRKKEQSKTPKDPQLGKQNTKDEPTIQQTSTTPANVKNKKIIPPLPKTTTHNPSLLLHKLAYRDDWVRRMFWDMNLWIPLVIAVLILGRILYGQYERQIKMELQLDNDLGLSGIVGSNP
jgi:hypothetical protein